MNRLASASVLALSLALVPPVSAQAAKATPAAGTSGQAAAPALVKMSVPVKGVAHIEIIQSPSKFVGDDVVTTFKVKNVSDGAIAGLRIDEFWYDKKLAQVTGDTERVHAPIQPGQVVEVTMKSPKKPDLYKPQWSFSHANGKVDVKAVKKFEDASSVKKK